MKPEPGSRIQDPQLITRSSACHLRYISRLIGLFLFQFYYLISSCTKRCHKEGSFDVTVLEAICILAMQFFFFLNTENYQIWSDGSQEVLTCILSVDLLWHNSCHFHTFECSILGFKLNCLKNIFLFWILTLIKEFTNSVATPSDGDENLWTRYLI